MAFASADISSLLQEFIRFEDCDPSSCFSRRAEDSRFADSASRSRRGTRRLLTDKLLCALAWVGDERVVDLFAGWRARPPSWAADLHIPPHQYSQQAGWELSPDSQRRNLYHEICYPLISAGASMTPSPASVLTEANLFELDGTSQALAFLGCAQKIVVPISERNLIDDRLPRRSLLPAVAPRSPWHAAIDSLPTQYSQLGGHPAWIQDAEYPSCGECRRTCVASGRSPAQTWIRAAKESSMPFCVRIALPRRPPISRPDAQAYTPSPT